MLLTETIPTYAPRANLARAPRTTGWLNIFKSGVPCRGRKTDNWLEFIRDMFTCHGFLLFFFFFRSLLSVLFSFFPSYLLSVSSNMPCLALPCLACLPPSLPPSLPLSSCFITCSFCFFQQTFLPSLPSPLLPTFFHSFMLHYFFFCLLSLKKMFCFFAYSIYFFEDSLVFS